MAIKKKRFNNEKDLYLRIDPFLYPGLKKSLLMLAEKTPLTKYVVKVLADHVKLKG